MKLVIIAILVTLGGCVEIDLPLQLGSEIHCESWSTKSDDPQEDIVCAIDPDHAVEIVLETCPDCGGTQCERRDTVPKTCVIQ